MKPTGLFLTKDQVLFAGMTLAICVEGKEEPETGPEGNPLVVMTMIGGVSPMGLRFYPLDLMSIKPGGTPSPYDGRPMSGSISASSFPVSEALPHVRFMPTEVFTGKDVPVDRECAVFANGDFLKYDDFDKHEVRVVKRRSGQLVSIGYSEPWREREYPLPEGAKLVPVSHGASFAGLAATHPAVVGGSTS